MKLILTPKSHCILNSSKQNVSTLFTAKLTHMYCIHERERVITIVTNSYHIRTKGKGKEKKIENILKAASVTTYCISNENIEM